MLSSALRVPFGRWVVIALALLPTISFLATSGTAQAFTQVLPTLPQLTVDTTMPAVTGNTYTVNAGGDLQAAINSAAAADPNLTHVINIAAGATFTGPFYLRARAAGTGWVLLRSSAIASLPSEGSRVGPTDASNMPKLVTLIVPYAVQTDAGAHHYRFIGIEFTPGPGVYLGAIVNLGSSLETNVSQLPYNFVFDRCYVHGDPVVGSNKGIAMNGNSIAVIDSYVSDLKSTGNPDTNAVWTFNGAGPFKIVNNYLESGGENVMIGGAIPTIVGLIPSDIEIGQNHIAKPVSWNPNNPAYGGTHYLVKNLLEMKSGNRVLITGNIFENVWPDAQPGFTFELTPRSDTGTWTTVDDITITYNIAHDVANGVAISGFESGTGMVNHSKNVLVSNNLLYNVGVVTTTGPGGPPGGSLYEVANGIQNVTIDHNTGIQTGLIIASDVSSENNPDFTFTNNIAPHNTYGVFNGGVGTYALDNYFSPYVFDKNVIAGLPSGVLPSQYPTDNFFPNSLADVGFTDQANNDYQLLSSSPYKNGGTDGKDIGADIDAVNSATAGVVQGTPGGGTSTASAASSKGGRSCFIATAAYGSPLQTEVVLLRTFRDQHLLTNRAGRAFVHWYYRISPPLAARIQDHAFLKGLVRTTLWPVVGVVWLVFHPGIGVGLMVAGGILGWLRSPRKRKSIG